MNSFRRVLQQLKSSALSITGSNSGQRKTGIQPFLQRAGLGFCLSLCLAGLLWGGPAATLSYGQTPEGDSGINGGSQDIPPTQLQVPATTAESSPEASPQTNTQPSPQANTQLNPQATVERAAVLVNGTTVFEVGADLARTATERAQLIQLQINTAIETDSGSLVVSVGDRNGTPALLLNDTLLTLVTSADITDKRLPSHPANDEASNNSQNNSQNNANPTPQQQAQDWAKSLQAQLDQLPPLAEAPSSPLATTNLARPTRAPVEINSRRLFRVAEAGGESATRRAAEISGKLESLDPLASASQVKIREEVGSPTLWVQQNDRDIYLLTVTQADATATTSPTQIAKIWARAIDIGLQETRKELKEGIQERLVSALGVVGIALMIQWGLIRLWNLARQRLEMLLGTPQSDEEEHPSQLLNFSLKILLMLVLTVLWLSALLYIANFFPITRELSNTLRDYLINTLTAPIIPIGDGYSLASFVLLGGVLTAMLIASSALTDFLRSRFLDALGIGMGLQEAISVVFKYSFITLSFIILLQLWGIDLSSLAILASALGVGIGFGLQDIAKNLGSGLVLVFERPIQVGDFVEVGGYTGTIEKLGARSTRLRTMDDLTVFVPNSRFLQEEVTNWSHRRTPSRITIPVGVAYGSDLEVVKEALLDAAQAQKAILKAPKPQVFFMGFGDSSLDFVLLVWISRPQLQARLKSDLNFKIDAAFRQRQIEIPFPQRDLHMHPNNIPMPLMDNAHNLESASTSEPAQGSEEN